MIQNSISINLGRPYIKSYDVERKISELFFQKDQAVPSGEYYLRGGICFPVINDDGISGYATMCGKHLGSGVIYVLEEQEFCTIDHIKSQTGRIEFKGLSTWFNDCWTNYFADSYYYHQDYETCKKYRLQVIRSIMINPKPHFIEIKWQDADQAMHTIFEKDMLNQLKYSSKGKIYQEMQEYNATPDEKYPALHALKCALAGYDRYGR